MAKLTNHRKKKVASKRSPFHSSKLKWVSTKLLDDVFTDEVSLFKPHFEVAMKLTYSVYGILIQIYSKS